MSGELHCFEDGPATADGCPTVCMLALDHAGPHEWSRGDEVIIRFAPIEESDVDKAAES